MDKVCADVVLLHGCPQSRMPNPVEGLLEDYEDMIEVLLVLEMFLTKDCVVTKICLYNNISSKPGICFFEM